MSTQRLLMAGLFVVAVSVSAQAQTSDDAPTAISVNIRAASDGSPAVAVVSWTQVVLTAESGIVSGTYGNGRNLCLEAEPGTPAP